MKKYKYTLFSILLFSTLCFGQNSDGPSVALRAKFLLHIVNYARWEMESSRQLFCFLKPTEQKVYQELLKEENLRQAKVPLQVIQVDSVIDAIEHHCHYLFISKFGESQETYSKLALAAQHMITIGETNKFVSSGGLMGLRAESDKIRIYISRSTYKKSPVKFSARLLRFASFTG